LKVQAPCPARIRARSTLISPPPDDALVALGEDHLPEEEALRLFGHIATCAACEGRLNYLSHDPIFDQVFNRPLAVVDCQCIAVTTSAAPTR
jgi:hypothetical protein